MHQGNPVMSTNFAASTHEFPEVDVVPVTELERIPKRNWEFCPMARSPMARPSFFRRSVCTLHHHAKFLTDLVHSVA